MEENKIIAYKGFDENLCCKGFQYEIGKEYVHKGKIECCMSGFHACTNPFDVLKYYGAGGNNRFCKVEQSGIIKSDNYDSKQSSSKIKIKAEIGRAGLFKAGVRWIKEETNPIPIIKNAKKIRNNSSDNSIQIGSIDDCDNIYSSSSHAKIGSIGESARICSHGDFAQIGSSGVSARICSSGYYAEIGSSGYAAYISSSGDYARIGSSGYCAQIGSSGNSAIIGLTGDDAQIGLSGDYSEIGSSGCSTKIGSSGDYVQIGSAGKYSVICCAGKKSIAKAKIGSWITLSEWKYSEEEGCNIPVCVKTEYVDGERIKEDTWYKLVDGEFREQ